MAEELSKNQLKRLRKQEVYEANKEEYMERRREKRKETKKRKKESGWKPPRKIIQTEFKLNLILDLSFVNKMSEKEKLSTAAQIQHSYAAVKKHEIGTNLFVSSLTEDFSRILVKKCRDYERWTLHHSSLHYLDWFKELSVPKDLGNEDKNGCSENLKVDAKLEMQEFSKSNFCYLTADSPNELNELDPDVFYVIGAIVDKNRYPRLCLDEAEKLGLKHAKLPISSYVQFTSRKILTINQVVEIMANYSNNKDWKKSFLATIPSRKNAIPIL